MTYTKETEKKWENENGKTSHMKVLMVHDVEECEKECTATAPCIAFTFIPGMEIASGFSGDKVDPLSLFQGTLSRLQKTLSPWYQLMDQPSPAGWMGIGQVFGGKR